MKAGTIVAVCTSKHKGERKQNVGTSTVLTGLGLEGDAHAGFQHRQISLLALESIEKMQRLGLDVHPGDFAENLTVSGLDLVALPVGTKMQVNDVLLEVSQIGKECHTRCAIYYQAGDCVMPKEGIFAVVLTGGTVSVGDRLEVVDHV
jgi:MOSC domain-containing protein YiiM